MTEANKLKNFNLSLFLGCCVIGVCVIIAGIIVANNLPETTRFPQGFSITNYDGDTSAPTLGEYLTLFDAAHFLKIDINDLDAMVNSGELDGTFTAFPTGYVFSKERLTQWMERRFPANNN
jgi:hypothetical protein